MGLLDSWRERRAQNAWRQAFARAYESLPTVAPPDLLLFDPNAICPKCGCKKIDTAYAPMAHWGCPLLPRVADLPDPDSAARLQRIVDAVPEHQERTCLGCDYRWAEQVRFPSTIEDLVTR